VQLHHHHPLGYLRHGGNGELGLSLNKYMPLSRAQVPLTNPLVLPSGGSIDTFNGGSIDTSGNDGGGGGSINTSGASTFNGGSISTQSGIDGNGGSINTSNGGGSINLSSSGGSINLSDLEGGSINLSYRGGSIISSGVDADGSPYYGGTLNMSANNFEEDGSEGGDINTQGGNGFDGGSINTSGGGNGVGGSINTSGGAQGAGGSINISNGGGSINLYSEYTPSLGGSITSIGVDDSSGGSLLMSGGAEGAGGNIDTSNNGGEINISGAGAQGGSIDTRSVDNNSGGSINTYATEDNSGGNIYTYGGSSGFGGSIDTSGGSGGSGGSINTSNGGGSINTQGVGSIQFGISGTRTTLNGSATAARTATLPNITGTLPIALISASTALNFGSVGGSGGFADLTITLTGAATTDVVFVTCLDTAGRGATDGKLIFEAFVSSANTVTVRAHNPTSGSIDPASYNFKVAIIKTA